MIVTFVLGLPRSGTTVLYNAIYRKLNSVHRVLGVFEPTNYDVVSKIAAGVHFIHDVVGEVYHDMNMLTKSFMSQLVHNAKWHVEWADVENPTMPYLGPLFDFIIRDLEIAPVYFIVKDVHAWVKLPVLARYHPHTLFIATLMDRDSYFAEASKRIEIGIGRFDFGAVSIPYRYITGRLPSKDSFIDVFNTVYDTYVRIVNEASRLHNVHVVRFAGRLSDTEIENVASRALEWFKRLLSIESG